MKIKQIQQLIEPPPSHMVGDGFKVHNFFPQAVGDQTRMSPFFLLDYGAKFNFSPTNTPRGVGVHPHRGFETVTISYKGGVAHHDSYGNKGIISEGDVQWMTAASGILHKEYHESEYSKKGGPFQMVQIWVNLPAKHKMTKPKYQALQNKDLANYFLPDNKSRVEVIAGNFKGTKGPAFTFSPIEMYNLHLNKESTIMFDLPEHYNTSILVIEGSVIVNDIETVLTDHLILFKNEGEQISIKALTNCIILLLSGEPINEPIAASGPFLMNTKQELVQAYEDFNAGKFGYLEA